MPMTSVTLRPGVDIERTQSLNEAGFSQSQMIRFKSGMVQTNGGWVTFASAAIPSVVRDLHAWQGLVSNKFLGVGATGNLIVVSCGTTTDVTPQLRTSNPAPNFSVSSGSNLVTIVDAGSSTTTNDTVFFNTPIALSNLLLNGAYKINSVGGSSIYTILASTNANTTVTSSGILPIFATSSGNANITTTLPNNGFQSIPGLFQTFYAATTVTGLTVQGPYQISSVIDSTNFVITATTQSSGTGTATMNGGNAQLVYYIAIGPQVAGSGFGAGGFGGGGFGTGVTFTGGTGTPITTTDWTLDNWGEVLLACPKNGAVYTWSADSGLQTAQVIQQAPFFSGGIFVSMPQQILVSWASVESTGTQDPLVVRWSNAGDYTNWTVSNQTTAGSFHFPTGSQIIGAIQGPVFAVISTDVDVWVMQYVGGIVIFNFTRVGSGCGWIGPHAAGVLGGSIYWCGTNNFFVLSGSGVQPIPCTVWDFIFQNLNTANQSKVRCAVNSTFNEIMWLFPSAAGGGECDSYVKVHIEGGEFEWDYGSLGRTAWIDLSILGNPIAADNTGVLWQHDVGQTITGAGLPSFQTGWWSIADGQQMAFVDFVIPDMIWGLYGNTDASVTMTFFSTNYPGDTPISYGPYTVTQQTEYLTPRIRGRLMSVQVQSNNARFWRLGRIRYRFAAAGRR